MNDFSFLKITRNAETEFEKIAEKLFNEFAIMTKYGIYRLLEIEFYWNSSGHRDKSTYKRKYVNPKQGEWFFHYSGVDIALRNDEINGYGGILIRKIKDIKTNEIFKGPMVCAMKLFSGISAVSEDFFPVITKHNFQKKEIRSDIRINLGENAKEGKFDEKKYKFEIL